MGSTVEEAEAAVGEGRGGLAEGSVRSGLCAENMGMSVLSREEHD